MYSSVPSTAKPHVDSGKVFALATTGLRRTAVMPDVPTVAESGYPGFEATNWYAIVMSSRKGRPSGWGTQKATGLLPSRASRPPVGAIDRLALLPMIVARPSPAAIQQ